MKCTSRNGVVGRTREKGRVCLNPLTPFCLAEGFTGVQPLQLDRSQAKSSAPQRRPFACDVSFCGLGVDRDDNQPCHRAGPGYLPSDRADHV